MYWGYFKYVFFHKWYVFMECARRGLIWRGLIHDWSKFRPSEFIPYARYFYGYYPEYADDVTTSWPHLFKEDIKRQFHKAWLLHIHRNPHHWQHWLLYKNGGSIETLPMPIKYLREMGCDWNGAGKAITGENNTKEWYEKNKDKIRLTGINRLWIERFFINSRRS